MYRQNWLFVYMYLQKLVISLHVPTKTGYSFTCTDKTGYSFTCTDKNMKSLQSIYKIVFLNYTTFVSTEKTGYQFTCTYKNWLFVYMYLQKLVIRLYVPTDLATCVFI